MKQALCIIFAVLQCFSFAGCENRQDFQSPITYYYPSAEIDYGNTDGIIAPEIREATGHEEDLTYLINQYLAGPQSAEFQSPFPAGTTVENLELFKTKINIVLSPQFAQLNDHKLTIACTCLTKTLLDMADVRSVTISIKDTLISGEPYITMTNDDFVFTDSNEYIPDDAQ